MIASPSVDFYITFCLLRTNHLLHESFACIPCTYNFSFRWLASLNFLHKSRVQFLLWMTFIFIFNIFACVLYFVFCFICYFKQLSKKFFVKNYMFSEQEVLLEHQLVVKNEPSCSLCRSSIPHQLPVQSPAKTTFYHMPCPVLCRAFYMQPWFSHGTCILLPFVAAKGRWKRIRRTTEEKDAIHGRLLWPGPTGATQ